MCIFQDTDESSDWHAQSAVMGQIYSSAIVNIAASSAHDSRSGLKYQWNSMAMAPFFITPSKKARPQESPERLTSNTKFGIYPNDDFYVAVVTSPLNGRAWVLQERFLSTRVVHFTSSGVYWECMTGTCSSTYPLCLPESDQFFGIDDLKLKQMMLNARNKTLGGEQSVWTDELYGAWADTLSYYSNCNISFVRDKLVALNGIAKRLAETVDDELICGLWKRYLIPQLLWYVNERRNNVLTEDEWIAPTWSWASRRFGEEIHHSTHILCGVSKEVASIKRFSMQKRSSGQIIKASLELQGRVVHAHLALTMDKRGLRMDRRFSLNLDSPKEWSHTQFCVMLDEEESHAAGERVLCIALYEDDCERGLSLGSALYPNGAIEHLGVLVLQQYSLQPRVYKRIGIMLLQGHRSGLYKSQESAQEQDIVLM